VKKSRKYPVLKTWIPDLDLDSKKIPGRIQDLESRKNPGPGIIQVAKKTWIPDLDPGKIRPG
jgi:hypothetical protein